MKYSCGIWSSCRYEVCFAYGWDLFYFLPSEANAKVPGINSKSLIWQVGRVLILQWQLQYFIKYDIVILSYRKVMWRLRENKLADLSMDFAVEVLDMTDAIKGHYSLVNQIERSATSIGANIREANYGHGRADFIAKLQIFIPMRQGIG